MKNETYTAKIEKFTVQDDYNEGEIGPTSDLGLVEVITRYKYETIKEDLKDRFNDLTIYEDHFEAQRLENVDGTEASESEIHSWKKGETELWSANFAIYISKTELLNVTELEGVK